MLNHIYVYMVEKDIVYLYEHLKRVEKRALDELYRSVSQRANKIIFTDNVRIYFVYLVMIKIRNNCQILSIE
jgi:hypothetical protein